MQPKCQIFSGVIKEMGVIEPDDMTARLFTTESRMATGEVVTDIVKKGGLESIPMRMLKKFETEMKISNLKFNVKFIFQGGCLHR